MWVTSLMGNDGHICRVAVGKEHFERISRDMIIVFLGIGQLNSLANGRQHSCCKMLSAWQQHVVKQTSLQDEWMLRESCGAGVLRKAPSESLTTEGSGWVIAHEKRIHDFLEVAMDKDVVGRPVVLHHQKPKVLERFQTASWIARPVWSQKGRSFGRCRNVQKQKNWIQNLIQLYIEISVLALALFPANMQKRTRLRMWRFWKCTTRSSNARFATSSSKATSTSSSTCIALIPTSWMMRARSYIRNLLGAFFLIDPDHSPAQALHQQWPDCESAESKAVRNLKCYT